MNLVDNSETGCAALAKANMQLITFFHHAKKWQNLCCMQIRAHFVYNKIGRIWKDGLLQTMEVQVLLVVAEDKKSSR